MLADYHRLTDILTDAAQILLPPERLSVSQAAAKYRFLYNPGSYIGPWMNDRAPYLVEVMDCLTSRDYAHCIYVKPAQSGGTEVGINWMLFGAVCDPADFAFYEKSESSARDFGKDKLGKMLRHSEAVQGALVPGKSGTTAHAARFRNGTHIKLRWPSINQMSGHSTGRSWLTDYDRMDENIGGEGSPFALADKRGTSFGSFAMCFVESSPGRPILDHKWRQPKGSPHMAVPCSGVLDLYNGGDRRRWYWPCPDCGYYFEPCFHLMRWPEETAALDLEAAAAGAYMACPHCGACIDEAAKYDMNLAGHWIREADLFPLSDGERWFSGKVGNSRRKKWHTAVHKPVAYSNRASFWSKGPIAAFLTWENLVLKHLRAWAEYERTGDYEGLKATVNTDQCLPFSPPGDDSERNPDDLQDRAAPLGEKTVPEPVRLLLASVDVQKRRFVVQVHGIAPGNDILVIDRFDIGKSARKDADGDPEALAPATYAEDWRLLEQKVMDARYPLADGSGRTMGVRATICDSGGAASTIGRRQGVTEKAYNFYRYLKKKNKHHRFHLIKGGSNKNGKRLDTTWPDAERRDRHAGARGEIPVLLINVQILKDSLNGMLDRTEPGGGMVHFADWLPDEFYNELCAEVRDPVKGWLNPKKRRNEAWDLLVYCLTLMIKLKIETLNWQAPPPWAGPWDDNPGVSNPVADQPPPSNLSNLGRDLL